MKGATGSASVCMSLCVTLPKRFTFSLLGRVQILLGVWFFHRLGYDVVGATLFCPAESAIRAYGP